MAATSTYPGLSEISGPAPPPPASAHASRRDASRSGIWVGIFAITMSFAAFTSTLFVREGSANDWTHVTLPPILYVNTLVLLISSFTLEFSRRSLFPSRTGVAALARGVSWLAITFALGLAFVVGQYEAWRQLAARGLYLATNPNSSFFYVFTGLHAIHLLFGIAIVAFLLGRLAASASVRRRVFANTAIYWHFMSVLWLYLLYVLRTRI